MTADEKDILWKFRYYLSRLPQSLSKFLKSVDWSDPIEPSQTLSLLPEWTDISIDDALELLGPEPSFHNKDVRAFAVRKLENSPLEDIQLVLLQLVQAIKFEVLEYVDLNTLDKLEEKVQSRVVRYVTESPLVEFLVSRGVECWTLGNYLYWYLAPFDFRFLQRCF